MDGEVDIVECGMFDQAKNKKQAKLLVKTAQDILVTAVLKRENHRERERKTREKEKEGERRAREKCSRDALSRRTGGWVASVSLPCFIHIHMHQSVCHVIQIQM